MLNETQSRFDLFAENFSKLSELLDSINLFQLEELR